MNVTSIYAALLALLFVGLSTRTLLLRRSLKIAIGDGGDNRMLRAMRVHSNFAEYVPFGLLLLYLAETQGAPSIALHGVGLCLLIGRLSHVYGVSQENEKFQYRVLGISVTLTAFVALAGFLLFVAIRNGI
ncbi:MAPEG family protein [Phormidesmis priestleyi]